MPAKKAGTVLSTMRPSEGMVPRLRASLARYEAEEQAGILHTDVTYEHVQWLRACLREWSEIIAEIEKRERRDV